jgi:hypothetical protein
MLGRPFALRLRSLACFAALAAAGASCTVVSVQSQERPAGVRADGLIDGHAVVGWRDEKQALSLDLFDGRSRGAVFEFVLWKIARLELGLAGFGVGVGPFDVALGTAFYDPRMPVSTKSRSSSKEKANKDKAAVEAPAAVPDQPGACDEPGCAHVPPQS